MIAQQGYAARLPRMLCTGRVCHSCKRIAMTTSSWSSWPSGARQRLRLPKHNHLVSISSTSEVPEL
jgi:hypothetical protein